MLQALADEMALGALLEALRSRCGGASYELVDHWQQGEFHHDVVVRAPDSAGLPGKYLVVATNCNGGVKEVLAFGELPDRQALWHWRCPAVVDFAGDLPPILGRATTAHHFDPCALLAPDARSELREEHRVRQAGGGWTLASSCGNKP